MNYSGKNDPQCINMKTRMVDCGKDLGRGWWIFALFFYINIGFINAQNLVPNYSFEIHSACPTTYNCCEYATGWFKAKENINTGYTTDYLNSCGSSGFQVPNNNWGNQVASTGLAYQATATSSSSIQKDYRENMYAQLTFPTKKGSKYFASFKTSLTEKSKYATNNFGIKLSTTNSFPVNNNCQLYAKNIISSTTIWTETKSIITATDNWKYIAFGNFFEDSKTDFVLANSSISNNHCVYYVDDIILAELGFNSQNQCIDSLTTFILLSSGFIDSVKWNFNDVASGIKNSSSNKNPTHVFSKTGTYHVQLIVYIRGLVDTIINDVVINYRPDASFTLNDSIQCLSNNLFTTKNTTTHSSGTITYHWDFGDGSTSALKSPSHTYKQADTFLVKLITFSDFTCNDSFTKTVIVQPNPVAYFSINDSMQCLVGNAFVFNNASNGGNGNIVYFWDFGDLDTSTLLSPAHTYDKADTFNVKLLAISYFLCQDSITKTIIVHPNPVAKYSIYDSIQCLEGNSFIFTNFSGISTGKINYLWNFGDGYTSTLKSPSHSFKQSDSFTVSMICISDYNCQDTVNNVVIVIPAPQADFIVNDSTQCLNGNQFIFTNISDTLLSKPIFTWYFDNGHINYNQDTCQYNFNKVGKFKIILHAKLLNTCQDSTFKIIEVLPQPSSSFNYSIDSCSGKLQFEINPFEKNKYFWYFGNGETSNDSSPTIIYNQSGEYKVTLTVVSIDGCLDSTSSVIDVFSFDINNLNIPNIFTPDNDGINDYYFIKSERKSCMKGRLQIYNRWGQELYDSKNNNDKLEWDGFYNGILVSSGVYFYILTINSFNKAGTISVIY